MMIPAKPALPLRAHILRALALATVVATLLASPATLAQDLGDTTGNSGIGIIADELEVRQEEKLYIARGNAMVEQDGATVKADILTAPYAEDAQGKNQVTRVTAQGKVEINSDTSTAFGDVGVYEVKRQVAVLKGQNLRFTSNEDTITARDSLEFWQLKNLAVARGNAVAKREQQEIRADVLTALIKKGKDGKTSVQRIGAEGNVMIITPTEIVQAKRGVYDVVREVATLDGGVKITRGENQLNGQRAEINMKTGVSRLLSGSTGRVQGLIIPKDAPKLDDTKKGAAP
jgi:lipopolysaccharide export system protein LptA